MEYLHKTGFPEFLIYRSLPTPYKGKFQQIYLLPKCYYILHTPSAVRAKTVNKGKLRVKIYAVSCLLYFIIIAYAAPAILFAGEYRSEVAVDQNSSVRTDLNKIKSCREFISATHLL